MLPYFTNLYGNPHSINHVFGKKAKEAVEESRKMIANTIGASFNEIIFTSQSGFYKFLLKIRRWQNKLFGG